MKFHSSVSIICLLTFFMDNEHFTTVPWRFLKMFFGVKNVILTTLYSLHSTVDKILLSCALNLSATNGIHSGLNWPGV
jgi:hypothetical protein